MSLGQHDYDIKTIAVFDVLGSFLVETYNNSLYEQAKNSWSASKDQNISLVDAYRAYLVGYANNIRTNRANVLAEIKGINAYYNYHIQHNLTFTEFQNLFLQRFIPNDIYAHLTDLNKDKLMTDIIIYIVETATMMIIKQCIPLIITHRDKNNIAHLQEKMVDIMFKQRETYYTKFAITNIAGGAKHEELPYEDKLTRANTECMRLRKENASVKDTAQKLLKYATEIENKTKDTSTHDKITRRCNELESMYNDIVRKNTGLNEELIRVRQSLRSCQESNNDKISYLENKITELTRINELHAEESRIKELHAGDTRIKEVHVEETRIDPSVLQNSVDTDDGTSTTSTPSTTEDDDSDEQPNFEKIAERKAIKKLRTRK